jgi:hypothetical protein
MDPAPRVARARFPGSAAAARRTGHEIMIMRSASQPGAGEFLSIYFLAAKTMGGRRSNEACSNG